MATRCGYFTDFDSQAVPKHDAFHRAVNRLTPETRQAVNDAIIHAAVTLGLEDGRKLRVDTTVGETDVHHPTDNTLLWDSVRVLTRLVRKLDVVLPGGVGRFTNGTHSAKRRMQEIQRMTTTQRHRQQVRTYRASSPWPSTSSRTLGPSSTEPGSCVVSIR